jgi:hypothetical protein
MLEAYDNFLNIDSTVVDISKGINESNIESAISSNAIGYSQTTLNTLTGNESFKSSTYVQGISGWKIDGYGNVEFNNGVFRGILEANEIHIPSTIATDSFHTDLTGNSWWGAASRIYAPAYILNSGAAKFSNVEVTGISTVGGRLAIIIGGAINSSGNFVNNIINPSLNTLTKEILSDFNFGSTNYAGAVKAGTITWNSSGIVTGGSGVAIYRNGIVGAKNGTTTFSIGTNGNATFRGNITASTITGSTLQTKTSGEGVYIGVNGNGRVDFLDNNEINACILYASNKDFHIWNPANGGSTVFMSTKLDNTLKIVGGYSSEAFQINTQLNVDGRAHISRGIYTEYSYTDTDSPAIYVSSSESSNVLNICNTNSTVLNRPAVRIESNNETAGANVMYIKGTGSNSIGLAIENNSSSGYATLYLKQNGSSVIIGTNVSGCYLTKSGVWTNASSKTMKENFKNISVLNKLKTLDILEYNYIVDSSEVKEVEDIIIKDDIKEDNIKGDDRAGCGGKQVISKKVIRPIKHFTPMAEDFNEIFEFGNSDCISPADLAGVALQAIKELNEKVELLEAKLKLNK